MLDLLPKIAADVGLLILPLAIYVEWKVKKENEELEDKIDKLSEKIDNRFDILETDFTSFVATLRGEAKNNKERLDELVGRVDSWSSFLRRDDS